MAKLGKLYVIATPLGNRSDITLRALEVLQKISILFAEDTRECHKLLSLYEIPAQSKKIHSYATHNLDSATELAMEYLRAGEDLGLVVDRGTPGISDPGSFVVSRARAEAIQVLPVPGCSAVITALSVSGFPSNRFVFLGFLPERAKDREKLLDQASSLRVPIAVYEAPHRIRQTLETLSERFRGADVFVAREMTKVFESYAILRLGELPLEEVEERGEYTILLNPLPTPEKSDWTAELKLRQLSDREWSKEIAKRHGISSKTAYNELQKIKKRP